MTGGIASTHLGTEVSQYSRYLLLLVPIVIAVINSRTKHANGRALLAVLIMVAGLQCVNALSLGLVHLSGRWYILPLIAIGLWSIGLHWNDLKVVGYFCAGVSVLSLLMAATTSRAWMVNAVDASSLNETKALIGSRLLAGPFAQMNNLGMSVAVGVPFCMLITHKWRRRLAIVAILATATLASSRTSLLAVLATVGCMFLFRVVKSDRARRAWSTVLLLGISAVIVWLPLHTSDPHSFTNRGRIWLASREMWTDNWQIGLSTWAYVRQGPLLDVLQHPSYHGHNLFVTVFTCGGVVLIACMTPVAVSLIGRARSVLPYSYAPVLFTVIILTMSIAEMPLRIDSFEGASWVTWTALLALVLFDRDSVTETAREEADAKPDADEPRLVGAV